MVSPRLQLNGVFGHPAVTGGDDGEIGRIGRSGEARRVRLAVKGGDNGRARGIVDDLDKAGAGVGEAAFGFNVIPAIGRVLEIAVEYLGAHKLTVAMWSSRFWMSAGGAPRDALSSLEGVFASRESTREIPSFAPGPADLSLVWN